MPLTYIDRSRYLTYFECPMKRLMEYHIYGTGIRHVGSTIPLATGSYAHQAVEEILTPVVEKDSLPTEGVIRQAVANAVKSYEEEVQATNYEVEEGNRVEEVFLEQATLVSGLIFAWASHVLPIFLEKFKVISVEKETEMVLGCTCGLGPMGAPKDHEARGCTGLVLMSRPDIVAEDRLLKELYYIEIKTGSMIDNRTFEHNIQFPLAAAAIEDYYERELTGYYIHGLIKGRRSKGYNKETKEYSLPPAQNSPLCYVYYKPPIIGVTKEDVKFHYGKGVTKQYEKTPVWEIEFMDKPEGMSKAEYHVSMMDDEELDNHVGVFGPYPYPGELVRETLVDMTNVEKTNAEVFPYIRNLIDEKGLAHTETQEALRQYVPRSWNCKTFNSLCPYYSICTRREGWDHPLDLTHPDTGRPIFERRQPNHPIEAEGIEI